MSTIILSPSLEVLTDEIGIIRSEIKRLESLDKKLTEQLKASGAAKYQGTIYKSTFYAVDAKTTVNWKALAMHFEPSDDLITAHSTTGIASLSALVSKI